VQEIGLCAEEWEQAMDKARLKQLSAGGKFIIHGCYSREWEKVLLIFSLNKILPHIGEEPIIGNNDNGDPLHSNFEVVDPYVPDGCSIISYTHYRWYFIYAAENTVVVKICYFYPLLLAPYQR